MTNPTPSTRHPSAHRRDAAVAWPEETDALPTLPAALLHNGTQGERPPWRQRLLAALERAERCVTERFRVPPGGG